MSPYGVTMPQWVKSERIVSESKAETLMLNQDTKEALTNIPEVCVWRVLEVKINPHCQLLQFRVITWVSRGAHLVAAGIDRHSATSETEDRWPESTP